MEHLDINKICWIENKNSNRYWFVVFNLIYIPCLNAASRIDNKLEIIISNLIEDALL